MASFSERNGYVQAPILQRESMDLRLRNALWSVVHEQLDEVRENDHGDDYENGVRDLWVEFFGGARDEIRASGARLKLRTAFYKMAWNKVLDFIEHLAQHDLWVTSEFITALNDALEREHSAYRVSKDGSVIEVADEQQLAAINAATITDVEPVRKHLLGAQACYARRDDEGYRNCIKEAISGVETLVARIVGENITLGDGLGKLDKKVSLPPALREAWKKIYGYASERDGVRHGASGEEEPVTSAEALHMLVTCSSFVTYLRDRAMAAGITL